MGAPRSWHWQNSAGSTEQETELWVGHNARTFHVRSYDIGEPSSERTKLSAQGHRARQGAWNTPSAWLYPHTILTGMRD